ncbi:Putative pilin/flagellin [Haloferax volcanii]|nr:Putative pilin/flagellin [Haloferax alexandrinus]
MLVVCAAISGYATVLDESMPTADRDLAFATLSNVESALEDDSGVVVLSRLSDARDACPDGFSCRAVGPDAPADADTDSTRVTVRAEPGRVGFGTLRVEVWR